MPKRYNITKRYKVYTAPWSTEVRAANAREARKLITPEPLEIHVEEITTNLEYKCICAGCGNEHMTS